MSVAAAEPEPPEEAPVQVQRTMHSWVYPPAMVAVMVATPGATAVTMPLSETVATSGLLLLQVRVPVDPAGRKAGPRFQTSPAWDKVKSFRFRVKEVAVWLAGMVPEGSGERVGSTPPVGAGLALESGEPVGAAELEVTGGLEGWSEFRLLPRLTRG